MPNRADMAAINMRKLWIDYLRCLGVVGVLSIHVTAPFYNNYSNIKNSIWWIANIINASGRISVPLFIMISGAVLLGRTYTVEEFYKNRLSRLLIPVVFWSLFYFLFRIFNGSNVKIILHIFVEGMSYYHMWYLSMFLCLMAFAPFINQFVIGQILNGRDIFILSILFLVLYSVNWMSYFTRINYGVSIYWFKIFPIYICYFIFGYFISRGKFLSKVKKVYIKGAIVIILIFSSFLNYYSCEYLGVVKDYFVLSNYGPFVLILTFLVFLLFFKNSEKFKANWLVTELADSSFGIYLVHPFFLYYINKTITNKFETTVYTIPFTIVSLLIVSFAFVYFIRMSEIGRKLC
jgi:surface polysaccharide O-acyltransferase-like enzyme